MGVLIPYLYMCFCYWTCQKVGTQHQKESRFSLTAFSHIRKESQIVITWGKTGRRKPLFWNILHNIGESHAKYILSPKFFYVDLGSLLATESSVCKSWTESQWERDVTCQPEVRVILFGFLIQDLLAKSAGGQKLLETMASCRQRGLGQNQ